MKSTFIFSLTWVCVYDRACMCFILKYFFSCHFSLTFFSFFSSLSHLSFFSRWTWRTVVTVFSSWEIYQQKRTPFSIQSRLEYRKGRRRTWTETKWLSGCRFRPSAILFEKSSTGSFLCKSIHSTLYSCRRMTTTVKRKTEGNETLITSIQRSWLIELSTGGVTLDMSLSPSVPE